MKITVAANAKINLFLDVDSIRDNGYHNIVSIMQSVDLCDLITVEYTDSEDKKIEIICDDPAIPCDSRNIAYKAADRLLSRGKVKITINKNIPSEAGLAGGSADAAATLVAINKLACLGLSEDELITLGATIGADVPFCIVGGTCLVEGIGEKLTKLEPLPRIPVVIAKEKGGTSTPEAYRRLDEKYGYFKEYSVHQKELDSIMTFEITEEGLFNIFEETVSEKCPAINKLKNALISHGASGAIMSGSGTAVVGLFNDENIALNAVHSLKQEGTFARLCYTCREGVIVK